MSQNRHEISLERNLLRIRLINRQCEIEYSGKVFSGQIRNETKNTWEVMTTTGLKRIPKDQSKLRITINNQSYEINGNQMKGRHEDRIKRMRKRKW
ncbi:MAG: ribonuclease P protein subunit [Candidatus Heimdallarchaeota archaeon]|nr:MAG: ribonuclease P protein subunit [Candidatus Heimdallarchaeota archaeon]